MRKTGYFRLADESEDLVGPMRQLKASGCSHIVHDVASGAKTALPGLARLLDDLAPGDTLVIVRLADLGRSAGHIVDVLHALQQQNIHLQCLYPPLHFAVELSLADWLAHFAEAAAMLRAERGQKMRKSAQSHGKSVGRPQTFTPDLIVKAQDLVEMGYTIPEIADLLKVSRSGLYKHLSPQPADEQRKDKQDE